ncbi:MAG: ATP-binding protein [Janthinobacterium lividum]
MLRWLGTRSIATRLFLSAAFWSVLILLVAGITLSAINRRSAISDFDQRLSVYVRALAANVGDPGDEAHSNLGQLGETLFELPLSGWYWQITQLDGDQNDIRASPSLFAQRLPKLGDTSAEPEIGGIRRGYAIGPDDRRLRIVERVLETDDKHHYLVQVAASPEEVEADISSFNLALAFTLAFLALALIMSTVLQVRFGLRPLRRLGAGVAAIRQGDAERIEGEFPREIAPLANELNLLIAANREIVDRARTHVGNLAHALKTPLSVIVNEASAQGLGDPDGLGAKVRDQVQIMRDQVTYYLDRARAAARSTVIGNVTEVKPVIEGLVRTFGKIYRDRDIVFGAQMQDGLRFRGEKQDLEDLVGNLVDNAGKWAKGRVLVTVETTNDPGELGPSALLIFVDDDGAGLRAEARGVAARRGRRLDESKPGSGLGLSIVTDLAGTYGGSFALDESPMGGLRAILRLPGSRADTRSSVA